MKKLIYLAFAAIFATSAFAGGDKNKITSDFDSLDNNNDQYVSQEEADDNDVWSHFSQIDQNGDNQLSADEFNNFIRENPTAAGKELREETMNKENQDSMY